MYSQTISPSQATGVGVDVKTALTILPQESVISAGAPGLTASAGQLTVDTVFTGAVKPPL